jgi:hypothetical protein
VQRRKKERATRRRQMTTKAKHKTEEEEVFRLINGRRYASTRVACRYGKFSPSRCFALLKKKSIRAKKFDGRILVDLDSIDEMYATLPDV